MYNITYILYIIIYKFICEYKRDLVVLLFIDKNYKINIHCVILFFV